MRALLLAAGYGRRLGSVAEKRPKPMIEVGGKPILQHNLELLARAGVRDVIVNLHHGADSIREHFGDGSAFGVAIEYAYEPVLLGTAGAARNVAARLRDGDFIVAYGDNLSTIDLSALVDHHRRNRADATIALFYRDDARASGLAGVDGDDRVLAFAEKPQGAGPIAGWVNAGYLVLRPAVLDEIPAASPSDFGHDLLPQLVVRGARVYGYRMSESLWWIDTPADYERTILTYR